MSLLFPSPFDEILFWVVFLGGLVVVAWVIKKAGGHREPELKRDRTESRLVGLAFLFIIPIPFAVGYARIGVLPSDLFYPGLVAWVVGNAIADWGVLVLGRFRSGFE